MTPDRAERAVDAAFGPGAWAEAGEHMTRAEWEAERWRVAAAKFGFRCDNGRTLTAHEQAAADAIASMADRILTDRDFAGLATDRDMDRAADDYFQQED